MFCVKCSKDLSDCVCPRPRPPRRAPSHGGATQLQSQAVEFGRCPSCDAPFYPFLRGQVQRRSWPLWPFWKLRPYCAVICSACKNIVGWETPDPKIGGKP